MVAMVQVSPCDARMRRGKSLDAHVSFRVRNQDGSGLTIRIPRPQSDRGSSPLVPSTSPPPVPHYAQLTTSRYAHMAPLPHSGAALVPKSKSLSTGMDKLSLGHHNDKLLASGHPQPPGSRGSTPSSGRSSAGGPSRPPSRRSPAAQQKTSRIIEGAIEKSDSPCGSEISLNSGVSSSASVKSLQSVRSSSSASGRSSTELPRTSQPRSSKSQTPTRSTPVRRSSTNSSIRSSRSSTPPDPKQSTATSKAAISATNGNARGSSSPIVATHRKNAVSSRIAGINGSSPTHNTNSLKRRTASTSSMSSSSTPATGPRKMSMATSDCRSSGPQQQGSAAETTKKGLPIFNSYMSLFQVQEKLKKGEVIEGVLRINPKNYEDAYISAPVILGRGDGHLYWRGT